MKKIRIFLADLIHNRHINNYCVPLNIGFVSARLNQRVGKAVETKLYKFPDDLIEALKNSPDILALSNYDWNVNLNRAVIKMAKEINPEILIIMGGPNINKSQEGIRRFLLNNQVDIYVVGEGEDGFCGIIEYILGKWPCNLKEMIFHSGNKFANAAYLESETNKLMLGGKPPSFQEEIIPFPSPWLAGILDSYLNESSFPLYPLIETNRGCPYQCYYCTWGDFSTKKIRKFGYDTVIEELTYIFKNAKYKFNLTIADANFGILERDIAIAEQVRRLSDKYKTAQNVFIAQAKDLKRNLEISKILGKICVPEFAVQTLTEGILENVGRKNVSHEAIRQYVSEVNSCGEKVLTDILVGLPGETKGSFIDTMKKVVDFGFEKAQVADIRLLHGSRMDDFDYKKQHGIESCFRVIPSAYGEYGGVKAIEYEECIRKTNTMSSEDFLELRLFNANFFLLYYVEFGQPLLDYYKNQGFNPIDLISLISRRPSAIGYPMLFAEVGRFIKLAGEEWYKREEDADDYYLQPKIFDKLMKEGFPKLNYEYAAKLITSFDLRTEFFKWVGENIKDKLPDKAVIVDDIVSFCLQRVYRFPFDYSNPVMDLSKDSFAELKQYIFDSLRIEAEISSFVRIKFSGDEGGINALKKEVERNNGKKNISLAIQIVLQKNQKAFLRELPKVETIG